MHSVCVDNFKSDESGAVTVDWVVLTASIVGLGIAVLTAISMTIGNVQDVVDEDLASAPEIADLVHEDGGGD